MKKLFVVLFVFVFAGMMMAQSNTSTVTVSGSDNSADVTQKGTLNSSTLEQSKDNNLLLLQDGNSNRSNLRQANFGGNNSYVDQIGDKNILTGLQGTGNLLDLDQTGNENYAKVNQDMSDQFAYITQTGYYNKAFVKQDSKDNYADIDQVGYYNHTNVRQADGTVGNTAIVNIDGDYNGYGLVVGDDKTDVIQLGSGNQGTINITGNRNDADINQTGDNNIATTTIDYYGDGHTTAEYNVVNVNQVGNSNESYNLVKGAYNDVDISQTGVGSHREYLQIFGSSNDVDIISEGTNNRGSWWLGGGADDNVLYVKKTGVHNIATGSIKGDENDVNIYQFGSENEVGTDYSHKDGVVIDGNSNNVDINQLSDYNSSLNTITGSGNNVTVYQD